MQMRTRKERGPTRARNDQTDMDESTVLVQRKKERERERGVEKWI